MVVVDALGMSVSEAITAVWSDPRSKILNGMTHRLLNILETIL